MSELAVSEAQQFATDSLGVWRSASVPRHSGVFDARLDRPRSAADSEAAEEIAQTRSTRDAMSDATKRIVLMSLVICPFLGLGMIVGYYTNTPIVVDDLPSA